MKYGRKLFEDVKGYVPGEQLNRPDIIKLNTNENPYPPSPKALEALGSLGAHALRKYPDPVSQAFRDACAQRYGCEDSDWVIVGNGMDELLSLVLRTFVDPGDTVVATYPTYSLYEILCALHGVSMHYVDLDDDFQLTEPMFEAKGRLCFITRPNAPSGVVVPREDIARLCECFPGIVVIDEAYVDFADDNCLDFPARYENAIVMRTFSKSFSLAGMRIGTAVARPELIAEFLKTKDSYNMDAVSQAVGIAAMQDYAWMEDNVARVCATRKRVRTALVKMGFDVPVSQSNFLLAHWAGTPSAKVIFEALRERAILVRYFDSRRLQEAIRITVGTDDECDALLAAIEEIIT